MASDKLLHFVETPTFRKRLDRVADLNTLFAIQADLLENPKCGDVIQGCGGARKGRFGYIVSCTKISMTKNSVSNEFFEELKASILEGLEHAKGNRNDLRVTTLPRPPKKLSSIEIAKIRSQANLSQSAFARHLNVSIKTVQSWEQGTRTPSDAALKLLSIARDNPQVVFIA